MPRLPRRAGGYPGESHGTDVPTLTAAALEAARAEASIDADPDHPILRALELAFEAGADAESALHLRPLSTAAADATEHHAADTLRAAYLTALGALPSPLTKRPTRRRSPTP